MRQPLKWTGLILVAGAVGLALAFAFTSFVRTRRAGTITMEQAAQAARQYVAAYGNPDLMLTEVMEFEDNFYVEVEVESTSIHAFELLVDRNTGAVFPEPGPNMMWNTRYGHMGGMMGGWRGQSTGAMVVAPEQARQIAQQWLDRFMPGKSAAKEADAHSR